MQFSTFLQTIRFVSRSELSAHLARCLPPDAAVAARDVLCRARDGAWPIFGEQEFTRCYYAGFLHDYADAVGLALDPADFARACVLHYTVRLTLPHEALLDLTTPERLVVDAFALAHGDPAFSSILFVPHEPAADDPGARHRSKHPASGVSAQATRLLPADLRYLCGSPRYLKARIGAQRISTLVIACDAAPEAVVETLDLLLRELSGDLFVLLVGGKPGVAAMASRFAEWFERAQLWASTTADESGQGATFAHLAVSPASRRGGPSRQRHDPADGVATRPLDPRQDAHGSDHYRYIASRQEVLECADDAAVVRGPMRVALQPPKVLLAPARFVEQMRGNFAAEVESWWQATFLDLPLAARVTYRDVRLVGCGHCFTRDGLMFDSQMQEVGLADLLKHAGVQRSDAVADAEGRVTSRRAAETTQVLAEPAICIGNGGLPMHAHFLLDVVGKLAFLGAEGPGERLVLLPGIATPQQLDDIARVYDIPRERLRVYDEHRGLHCKDLQVLPIAKLPPWLAPEMVTFLRRGLAKARFPAHLDRAACKRLFVGRGRVEGGPRRLLNEAEVRDLALRHGFLDIEPSDYTLEEEIALFDNADEVIFLYGSACGNVVFCRPDARVLILQSDAMTEKTFGMVCGLLGTEYGYVFGSSFHRWHRGHNSDWVIDPALVEEALARLRDPAGHASR